MTVNTIKEIGGALLGGGYEPLPITPGQKIPRLKGWSQMEITHDVVAGWATNGRADHYVGLRTGAIAGVDIDVDDPAMAEHIRADAEAMLGYAPVRYGRGSRMLLVYRVEGAEGRKMAAQWHDTSGHNHAVEVLQRGQQFVAYGVHPTTGQPYRWEGGDPLTVPVEALPAVTTEELAEWLRRVSSDVVAQGWTLATADTLGEDERWLATYRPPVAVEAMTFPQRVEHEGITRLGEWVPELFPTAREYRDGYRVTSADLGRDLEEDLALQPDGIVDFGEEVGLTAVQVVERWLPATAEEALQWLAERLGIDRSTVQPVEDSPLAMWRTRIEDAEDVARLSRITDAIRRSRALSDVDRELLAQTYRARMTALTSTRLPIALARQQVRGKAPEVEESDTSWCDGWYYVHHTDRFYHHRHGRWVTLQGFNSRYGRMIEPDVDGRRSSAARVALDEVCIPVADVGMYAPHLGERFTVGGRDCVNTFWPGSVPEADAHISAEGMAAITTVDTHLRHICGHRDAVYRALVDWLAYTVQHPGRKIRHAILLKGVEGDGKTVLLDLLAACIGEANVRTVSPVVVTSQFNGYAEGAMVVGLEELRMVGHNRYDAANALKPLITNNTVDIHKKGQDSYNALNVSNYLAFTNYGDAVPISETDRRWCVIFTPWHDAAGMSEALGGQNLNSYFKQLHAALQHGGALRRWLLDHPVSEQFDPNGHAPDTPEKGSMRSADVDDVEQLVADRIEAGGRGVTSRAVVTHLLRDVGGDFGADSLAMPSGRAFAKVMQRLGWTCFPRQLKWNGDRCRVWVRGLPLDDADRVRAELDGSLP